MVFHSDKVNLSSATKFAAHKTREIGFPQFRRPLCPGFHRPLCHSFRVLSLFGPKIDHHLSLTSLATFDIYIYIYIYIYYMLHIFIYTYVYVYIYIYIYMFICFLFILYLYLVHFIYLFIHLFIYFLTCSSFYLFYTLVTPWHSNLVCLNILFSPQHSGICQVRLPQGSKCMIVR